MSSARPSAYYSGLFFAVLFAIAVLAKLDQPFDWEAARDARMDPDPGFEQAAPRGWPFDELGPEDYVHLLGEERELRVLDGMSRRPLPEAELFFFAENDVKKNWAPELPPSERCLDRLEEIARRHTGIQVDAAGRFVVPAVRGARVVFARSGERRGAVCLLPELSPLIGQALRPPEELLLWPPREILVRVRDTGGAPVAGVPFALRPKGIQVGLRSEAAVMDILDCGATDAASGVLRITGLAAWGALPMYSRLDWRETELLLWVPGLDRTPRTLDLSSGSEHSMNWRLPPHGSLRVFLPDELLPIGEDPPAYVLDSETYAGARLALVGKGEWLAPVLGLGRKLKLRIGELRREIQGPTRAGEEMRFDLRDPERTALWLHFEGASDRELSRLTCSLRNDDYVMFEGRYDEFLHTALFRWLPVGQRLELTASIPDPQGRNGRRQVRHQLATPEKPGGIEHYTIDLSR